MKPFILSVLLIGVLVTNAQSDKYEAAMKKNLSMFDSAKSTADYQALSAAFERIGEAEKPNGSHIIMQGLRSLLPAGRIRSWTRRPMRKK